MSLFPCALQLSAASTSLSLNSPPSPVTWSPFLSIHFSHQSLHLHSGLIFFDNFLYQPPSYRIILLPLTLNPELEYLTLYLILHISWIFHWPIPLDLEFFLTYKEAKNIVAVWSYHFLPSSLPSISNIV